MFTGIIQAIGTIISSELRGGDRRLKFDTGKLPMSEVSLGDSIAVNGVCLTAIELGEQHFAADVSLETLSRTTLQNARQGLEVNLELALLPTTRLGGHLVSGHVDGIGRVISKYSDGRSWRYTIEAPPQLARYIAVKGSICINGVSLTVNEVNRSIFGVNIVPHTLTKTTLGKTEAGNAVNLEVDLLARYLERLLQTDRAATPNSDVTIDLLKNTGFIHEQH